jgi:hypothetical protein
LLQGPFCPWSHGCWRRKEEGLAQISRDTRRARRCTVLRRRRGLAVAGDGPMTSQDTSLALSRRHQRGATFRGVRTSTLQVRPLLEVRGASRPDGRRNQDRRAPCACRLMLARLAAVLSFPPPMPFAHRRCLFRPSVPIVPYRRRADHPIPSAELIIATPRGGRSSPTLATSTRHWRVLRPSALICV